MPSPNQIITDTEATCEVCGRKNEEIQLSKTAFNVPKTLPPFWSTEKNPEFREFILCVTDNMLMIKIRKLSDMTKINMAGILEVARGYRQDHPLKKEK